MQARISRTSLATALVALGLAVGARAAPADDGFGEGGLAEWLYARQCALCHGERGAADGPAAFLLFPPARDFTRATFKLAGTANGFPDERDLVATLRRGMPGSAMPAWSWMQERELVALARHVRALAFDGALAELRAERGAAADPDALRAEAAARTTPGEPVAIAPPAPRTPEVRARGERLFLAHCASCHGEDGKGRRDQLRRDEDQTLNWARDFTAGILKGGATLADLERRLHVGVHGTAMPAASLPPEERAALVQYVRDLMAAGSEDRLVQRRQVLLAKRVEALPARSDDPSWAQAPELELALAPLWWREDSLLRAGVAAMHDGERLALRVRWRDATPDAPRDRTPPLDAPPYSDAVAVQLSPLEHPPVFGMGAGVPRTDLWHWRALDVPEARDFEALLRLVPHRVGEWLTGGGLRDVPLYRVAEGPLHVAGDAAAARMEGMRELERQPPLEGPLAAVASWWAGEWEVVFVRPLAPGADAGLPLLPGGSVSFELALWNGAARDLRGQKSVTIWHALELEP